MNNNCVTAEQIESIILNSEIEVSTLGNKTTVVYLKTADGFVIVESSSCVDPDNYSEELGAEICMGHIRNKLWELEVYCLQKKQKNLDPPTAYGLSFGTVLEAVKADHSVKATRANWNGKGQYLQLQVPDENSKMRRPYFYIVPVDGDPVPWVASQTDLLAEDWIIY